MSFFVNKIQAGKAYFDQNSIKCTVASWNKLLNKFSSKAYQAHNKDMPQQFVGLKRKLIFSRIKLTKIEI